MLELNAFVEMRKCKVISLMRGLVRTIFLLLVIRSFLLSPVIRDPSTLVTMMVSGTVIVTRGTMDVSMSVAVIVSKVTMKVRVIT